jgi:2-amino-4-hydroxy-6-hydroxymethyldihydropteridine diphosphokinase
MGANLGDRAATLREAVRRLSELGRIAAVSSLYETEPVGFREQPSFLNAVLALETDRSPAELLHALIAIERDLGRVRTFRNAPRTLDLDILLIDDVVLHSKDLTIPHSRMHERAFVLAPLAEIAPDAVHPVRGASITELLAALPDQGGIAVWAEPGWQAGME